MTSADRTKFQYADGVPLPVELTGELHTIINTALGYVRDEIIKAPRGLQMEAGLIIAATIISAFADANGVPVADVIEHIHTNIRAMRAAQPSTPDAG